LDQAEYSGLTHVADVELRDPRDELRVILRRELARCGLWPDADPLAGPLCPPCHNDEQKKILRDLRVL